MESRRGFDYSSTSLGDVFLHGVRVGRERNARRFVPSDVSQLFVRPGVVVVVAVVSDEFRKRGEGVAEGNLGVFAFLGDASARRRLGFQQEVAKAFNFPRARRPLGVSSDDDLKGCHAFFQVYRRREGNVDEQRD